MVREYYKPGEDNLVSIDRAKEIRRGRENQQVHSSEKRENIETEFRKFLESSEAKIEKLDETLLPLVADGSFDQASESLLNFFIKDFKINDVFEVVTKLRDRTFEEKNSTLRTIISPLHLSVMNLVRELEDMASFNKNPSLERFNTLMNVRDAIMALVAAKRYYSN